MGVSSLIGTFLLGATARAEGTDLDPPVAYNYGELETPRSAAMGGALRAAGNSAAAVFLNPAAMLSTRVYHLEGLAQLTPEAARQMYAGAIVDSVTGRLAGGVSVAGGIVDPNGLDRSVLDARVALAYPLGDAIGAGITGRYLKVNQQGLGVFGDSKVSGGLVDPEGGRSPLVDTFSFDAGLDARLGNALRLGVAGQNLTYPGHGLAPTTLGGGIAYAAADFTIEADGLADFTSYSDTTARIMLGGEYLLGDHFPLRLGYRYDQGSASNAISAGLGYVGTEVAVEGAVRRSLDDTPATTLVFSLAYFLESTGLTRAPEGFE